MAAISKAQLEELRGALEAEKDSIEEETAAHGKKSGKSWTGSSESEGGEADPSDVAGNIEELAVNVPFVAELEKREQDISDALSKIKKGVYGLCEVCNKPILFKRLTANPAARTCIAHA